MFVVRKCHASNGLRFRIGGAGQLGAVTGLQGDAVRLLRSTGCRGNLAHASKVTSLNLQE